MTKKSFAILASVLARSALFATASLAVSEREWFARPATMVLVSNDAEPRV